MGDHANDAAGYHAPKGSALAKARIEAHNALDLWWQFGSMTRSEAYARLAKDMGLPPDKCHILLFGEERCRDVVRICREWNL